MKKVLFLCTGNYYRSRMAEELFNHLSEEEGLDWQAFSLGLREDMSKSSNIGPMSPFARAYLQNLDVPIKRGTRLPRSFRKRHAGEYEMVIAVDEREHKPMMDRRFPDLAEGIAYWQVRDVQFDSPEHALPQLEIKVRDLIREIGKETR